MNHRIHLYFFLFSRTPKHRFWKLKTFFNSLNLKNEELSHLPLWRGNEGKDSEKEKIILKKQNCSSKQEEKVRNRGRMKSAEALDPWSPQVLGLQSEGQVEWGVEGKKKKMK